jgi:hypothetical protein
MSEKDIQNPGSALGEAIGSQLEIVLNERLSEFVDKFSCRLVSKGQKNHSTQKATKLLLYDQFGTAYNIDAVIVNESMQPLILLEYKYLRYKKHNRDKGSWLCTAHDAIRRRYTSIRSSIAILAGNWSGTSLAMMQSHEINLFVIPFEHIVKLLQQHGIIFDWNEKDRTTAIDAWNKYGRLTVQKRRAIAENMVALVKSKLESIVEKILDDQTPRQLKKVTVEIHSNLGEIRYFEFPDTQSAIEFLEDFSIDEILDHANSFTLFDKPSVEETFF